MYPRWPPHHQRFQFGRPGEVRGQIGQGRHHETPLLHPGVGHHQVGVVQGPPSPHSTSASRVRGPHRTRADPAGVISRADGTAEQPAGVEPRRQGQLDHHVEVRALFSGPPDRLGLVHGRDRRHRRRRAARSWSTALRRCIHRSPRFEPRPEEGPGRGGLGRRRGHRVPGDADADRSDMSADGGVGACARPPVTALYPASTASTSSATAAASASRAGTRSPTHHARDPLDHRAVVDGVGQGSLDAGGHGRTQPGPGRPRRVGAGRVPRAGPRGSRGAAVARSRSGRRLGRADRGHPSVPGWGRVRVGAHGSQLAGVGHGSRPGGPIWWPIMCSSTATACGPAGEAAGPQQIPGHHAHHPVAQLLLVHEEPLTGGEAGVQLPVAVSSCTGRVSLGGAAGSGRQASSCSS